MKTGAGPVIVAVAVRGPVAVGANATSNVHAPAVGMADPVQLSLVIRKSPGFAPLSVTLVTDAGGP